MSSSRPWSLSSSSVIGTMTKWTVRLTRRHKVQLLDEPSLILCPCDIEPHGRQETWNSLLSKETAIWHQLRDGGGASFMGPCQSDGTLSIRSSSVPGHTKRRGPILQAGGSALSTSSAMARVAVVSWRELAAVCISVQRRQRRLFRSVVAGVHVILGYVSILARR